MKEFNIKVITPDEVLFDNNCESLRFPVFDGVYEVMSGYVPTVFDVFPGPVVIKGSTGEETIDTDGGILTIKQDEAVLTTKKGAYLYERHKAKQNA